MLNFGLGESSQNCLKYDEMMSSLSRWQALASLAKSFSLFTKLY